MSAESVTTVEIIASDDPTALSLIVRVASTRPFSLARLHFLTTPDTKSSRVVMHVLANGRAELLSKRLNRIVSVRRVRLLDQLELSSLLRNMNDIPRSA